MSPELIRLIVDATLDTLTNGVIEFTVQIRPFYYEQQVICHIKIG